MQNELRTIHRRMNETKNKVRAIEQEAQEDVPLDLDAIEQSKAVSGQLKCESGW